MSAHLLEARLAELPALVSDVAARVAGVLAPGELVGRRVVVTGCGLSEPPARVFAAQLARDAGAAAMHAAPSEFLVDARPPAADLLVVFSHGLSPNGALPLAHAGRYGAVLVLTSLAPDAGGDGAARALARAVRGGARVVQLPPRLESGMYLRVLAPSAALLAAALLAEAAAPPGGLGRSPLDPRAVARAYAETTAPGTLVRDGRVDDVALVVDGAPLAWADPLRAKLLEGLRVPDPPIWDLLGLCHGPLQQFHARTLTLLVCTTTADVDRAAHDPGAPLARLRRVLDPKRHRLVPLAAPGDKSDTLGVFVREAMVHALLLEALRRVPLDLTTWSGEGADAPLYGLGPAPGAPEDPT